MSLRAVVRVLFISSDTVDAFLASVTLEQVTACTSMLESEVAHCDRARRARLLKQARFPVSKSAEGFGWSNVPFPDGWGVRRYAPPTFARGAEDLVFYGQTSRGKTRIATSIEIVTTSTDYSARFWQTAQLALQLGKAKREDTLDELLAGKGKAKSLVLDEFG